MITSFFVQIYFGENILELVKSADIFTLFRLYLHKVDDLETIQQL